MSEENKFIDPIHAQIEIEAKELIKKDEVLKKELIVRERKADSQLEKIQEGDRAKEAAKTTNYGALSEQDVLDKQRENTEYMHAAKNKMLFINKEFDKAIPFFRKNLILVGGKTGEGKSTTVANIIRGMISKTNPVTGKMRRILVLTNEEKSEDVYNRVTCLIKGWHYVNHDQFSEEQLDTFNKYIKALSTGGMLTVIDNNHNGIRGTTTTLEGICQIFDNLIANKDYYDAILIDYYQKIKESRNNPNLDEYKVQDALVGRLDQYKNIYPAPIVVLSQVRPPDDSGTPFEMRIKGRKSILDASTCCIEMIADREKLCTEWLIHKSRFNEKVGQSVLTGYDRGQFVMYDEEFQAKVAKMKASMAVTELNKAIGHMPEVKAEDAEEPKGEE